MFWQGGMSDWQIAQTFSNEITALGGCSDKSIKGTNVERVDVFFCTEDVRNDPCRTGFGKSGGELFPVAVEPYAGRINGGLYQFAG